MATIKVDIGQAAELFKKLGRERVPRAVERGVRSFLARAKPMMVLAGDQARPANPRGIGTGAFNTGNYRRSWQTEMGREDGLPTAIIRNAAPYAGVIEYGRRAGAKAPPISVIEPWVRRKLGVPFKKARSVAFLIARSIKRRGLKPRYVLTSRTQQFKLEKAFREEVVRSLIDAARGMR